MMKTWNTKCSWLGCFHLLETSAISQSDSKVQFLSNDMLCATLVPRNYEPELKLAVEHLGRLLDSLPSPQVIAFEGVKRGVTSF